MHDFQYHRPGSVDVAAAAHKAASEGLYLAGGQSLIPTLKQRLGSPSDLVDLGRIADLKGITADAGGVTIGAMTTHAEVAASADVAGAIPALAALAGDIGDPHVRNAGTLGGSLATNDPAADYPAAALALGATIKTNSREIAADDFFTGMFETALNEGEIITSVSFPAPQSAAYRKFKNPASRYAIVGVFVAKTADGVRVAVTGATHVAHRGPRLEAALNENFTDTAIDSVDLPVESLNSDIHASAEYRAHLVKVMAKRAIAAC